MKRRVLLKLILAIIVIFGISILCSHEAKAVFCREVVHYGYNKLYSMSIDNCFKIAIADPTYSVDSNGNITWPNGYWSDCTGVACLHDYNVQDYYNSQTSFMILDINPTGTDPFSGYMYIKNGSSHYTFTLSKSDTGSQYYAMMAYMAAMSEATHEVNSGGSLSEGYSLPGIHEFYLPFAAAYCSVADNLQTKLNNAGVHANLTNTGDSFDSYKSWGIYAGGWCQGFVSLAAAENIKENFPGISLIEYKIGNNDQEYVYTGSDGKKYVYWQGSSSELTSDYFYYDSSSGQYVGYKIWFQGAQNYANECAAGTAQYTYSARILFYQGNGNENRCILTGKSNDVEKSTVSKYISKVEMPSEYTRYTVGSTVKSEDTGSYTTVSISDRSSYTEAQKKNSPVYVSLYSYVTYTIKVQINLARHVYNN